jgi:HSP20 family protein
MTLQRWDPFRDVLALRDAAVDRLFEHGYPDMPVDMSETPEAVVVKASLPGVKPEDIDISVHNDRLTIRAESRADEERQDRNWHVREQHYGAMQRVLLLPTSVDADRADAHYENGVLSLTLPKAPQAEARHIRLGTQSAATGDH